MAAGDYGYGVQNDLLPALFLGASGDNVKDRSASMTMLQKALQMLSSTTGLSNDPMWAVLTGSYTPPPRQEYVPVQPITDSWLGREDSDPIKREVLLLSAGRQDVANAVANIMAQKGSKDLARANGAMIDEEGKWWFDQMSKVLEERATNETGRIAFEQEYAKNDYFAKNGLPSPYETYGLQADPQKGVQELPLDQNVMGRFQADLARFPAERSKPASVGQRSGSSFLPDQPSSGTLLDPLKQLVAKGKAASATQNYVGPNAANRAVTEGLMNFYKNTQLNMANAEGRTPLRDNLSNRLSTILTLLASQGVPSGE